MSDHFLCQKFLVATRHVTRKHGLPIDTGFGVTHTSDRSYWLVQSPNGTTMYEGQACCAYAARTEALLKLADCSPEEARMRVEISPIMRRFAGDVTR